MRTRRNLTCVLALAAALGGLGACGDDTGNGNGNGNGNNGEGSNGNGNDVVDTTADPGSTDGGCAGTDLEFTNVSTGVSADLTHTAAVSLGGGAGYTAYLADFELDPSEVTLFSNPTVPPDGNLVTFFVTVFDPDTTPPPIEAGTEITYTPDFGVLTFTLVHIAGDEQFGTNTGAAGTTTVTAVGDTFCAEVDYSDAEKTLSGTIEAAVLAS